MGAIGRIGQNFKGWRYWRYPNATIIYNPRKKPAPCVGELARRTTVLFQVICRTLLKDRIGISNRRFRKMERQNLPRIRVPA
jgi:hypothetical protein